MSITHNVLLSTQMFLKACLPFWNLMQMIHAVSEKAIKNFLIWSRRAAESRFKCDRLYHEFPEYQGINIYTLSCYFHHLSRNIESAHILNLFLKCVFSVFRGIIWNEFWKLSIVIWKKSTGALSDHSANPDHISSQFLPSLH